MRRNGAIDELRGLAVLAVVCSHVGLVYGLDSPLAFGLAMPALGVGVDLFFVLSGFVIWQNLAAMRAKAGGDAVAGALAFWLRRFSRVALPAWATLAAIGLLRLWSGRDTGGWSDLVAGAGFYANSYWAGCWAGNATCPDALIASHFWSLALEAQFYALAPLLAGLGRREALSLCALCLALGAVTPRHVGSFLWSVRPDGFLIGMALARHGPPPRLPGLGLGQAVYWLVVVAIFVRFAELGFSGFGFASAAIVFGGILVLAFFGLSHERAAARHEPGSKISVELSWLLEAGEYFWAARAQMRRQRLRCRHGISVGVWSPGRSARMQAKTDRQQKRGFRLT